MKTRSKFIQGICIFLFLTALTLGFSVSALASSTSTTLLTTVPSHFLVGVTIVGEGSVFINDTEVTQSGQISLERHKAVRICLMPEDNNRVDSVVYNGTSIIDKISNNEILLPILENNAELRVTFAVNSTIPNTGDKEFTKFLYFSMAASVSLFVIILLTVKRVRYKK